MEKYENQFWEMARRYGHSIEALQAGQEVCSTILVNNIDELKALLGSNLPKAEADKRGQAILDTFPSANDPINGGVQGITHRIEAYIYGNVPLPDSDLPKIKSVFPMRVVAFSADTKTLGPNEQWNLNDIDPSHPNQPVGVNLGTLTMEPGSSIIVRNRALNFTVGTLIRNSDGSNPGPGYDFAILGATGTTGNTGPTGANGSQGGTGKAGNCTSVGVAGDAGQTGGPGTIGITGGTGHTGGDGKASLGGQVTISQGITGNAGRFVFYTKSGTGGAGGVGGVGGDGGPGGPGGNGATCDCTGSGAGNGGRGGTAGRGGTGGPGGNGVNGSITFVTVPVGQGNMIIQQPTQSVPPGKGGTGGNPGNPGSGGGGGQGGKHNGNGSGGGTGPGNQQGSNGPAGTQYGNPGPIQISEQ